MIKRFVVFFIFIFSMIMGMERRVQNTPKRNTCLKCHHQFDYIEHKQINLLCARTAVNLLRELSNNQNYKPLKDEIYHHSLCLACLRAVYTHGEKVFCCSCALPQREVTLHEVYEIEAVSLVEYSSVYMKKWGIFAWEKLKRVREVIHVLAEVVEDNSHEIAIELLTSL